MTMLPRELLTTDERVGFSQQDLARVRENPKKTVAVCQLHVGRYVNPLLLKGELTTEGIVLSEHEEYGQKYSFGIRLEEPQDVEALQMLLDEKLDDAIAVDEEGIEWDTNPVIKNEGDVLYLKCKTNPNQTGFTFTSNLKLHPKKPNSEIFRYMPIEVEVMVGAYFNLQSNTRGLYFTVRDIQFKKPGVDTHEASTQTEPSSPAPPERMPKRVGGSGVNTRSTVRK